MSSKVGADARRQFPSEIRSIDMKAAVMHYDYEHVLVHNMRGTDGWLNKSSDAYSCYILVAIALTVEAQSANIDHVQKSASDNVL